MSWGRTYDSLQAFREDRPIYEYGQPDGAQLEAAKGAANIIIAVGAVGIEGLHDLRIRIAAHSNIDRKPLPGYANDMLTVAVEQK